MLKLLTFLTLTSLPIACSAPPNPPPTFTANSSMKVQKFLWEPEEIEPTSVQRQTVADVLSGKPVFLKNDLRHGKTRDLDPEGTLSITIDGQVYVIGYRRLSLAAIRANGEYEGEHWAWEDERIRPLYDEFNRLFKRHSHEPAGKPGSPAR
jgi:hypothetical protein